jgi:hypothetical protein
VVRKEDTSLSRSPPPAAAMIESKAGPPVVPLPVGFSVDVGADVAPGVAVGLPPPTESHDVRVRTSAKRQRAV